MRASLRYLLAFTAAGIGGVTVALQVQSSPPSPERTYVGTQVCISCHSSKYSATSDYQGPANFKQTMHQNIQQRPTPETVVIDKYFRGDSVLKAHLAMVSVPGRDTLLIHLFMSPDKKDYMMQMRISGSGEETPPMKVAYVHGGNGWKQRYLLEINGAKYVGPFQYVLPGYRKRNADYGEFYYLDVGRWIKLENGEAHFLPFNSNDFRRASWDNNCSPCHTTGPKINITVNGADSSWTGGWVGVAQKDSAIIDQNAMIGCENCHGPGSEHAANPTATNIINPDNWGTTKEAIDLKIDLCGSCHTRTVSANRSRAFPYDDVTGTFYQPGTPLRDWIYDKFSAMATWPDGFTSYAHHQCTQDYELSEHYKQEVFKNGCSACHSVHQKMPQYPAQLNQNWFSLKKGEGCVKCHEEKVATVRVNDREINSHTHHAQSMSQCVNCHMTRTASIGFLDLPGNQYWEFTKRLYDFSSHSFKVVPPSATIKYKNAGVGVGMINSCAESCHRNGRGSRNSNDSIPAAPYWNIYDNQYGVWNQATDIQLADTLTKYYQEWWGSASGFYAGNDASSDRSSLVSISPNPMVAASTISYRIAEGDKVLLDVYDNRGARVFTYAPTETGAGTLEWAGVDQTGRRLPNGTYFIRLKGARGSSEQRIAIER